MPATRKREHCASDPIWCAANTTAQFGFTVEHKQHNQDIVHRGNSAIYVGPDIVNPNVPRGIKRKFGRKRRLSRPSKRPRFNPLPLRVSRASILGNRSSKFARTRSMSRKRRRFSSKKGSAMLMARRALSGVRKLQRRAEVKSIDIGTTTIAAVGTAGDIRTLAAIVQGDASLNRDGDKIQPFYLKMRFRWLGTAASTSALYRTIIFRDLRQIESTVPMMLDVLAIASPLSQFARGARKRWKILFDQVFTGIDDAAIRSSFAGVLGLKLRLPMEFSGVANTTIKRNGLFMINITDLGANEPAFTFSSRMFFNDS